MKVSTKPEQDQLTHSSQSRFYNSNDDMPTEISRKRLHNKLLFVLFLVVALVVGFTQLPFRMQGRTIEIVTFGDWPLSWAVRRQFDRKQPELRSVIEFMNEQPDVVGLTVTPIGLRASLTEKKGIGHDLDEPNILQALISIEAHFVDGHEDRISVFLGTEYRGKTSFHASYVHPLKPIELPLCESIETKNRAKIGYCGMELSPSWYAVYKWEPTDLDELEQALEEMK